MRCLDCGTTEGVEYVTTPDRTDGRSFPRCPDCFDARLASAERTMEYLSPCRPSWHDEGYAGERWDDDY